MSTEEETPKVWPQGSEDAEQADWMAEDFEQGVRFDHTSGRWHIWNKASGIWAPDQTREVQRMTTEFARRRLFMVVEPGRMSISDERRKVLTKVYRRMFEKARVESALAKLAELTDYKTDGADWDQNPYLLGCKNGVVDLRVGQLIESPSPELKVTLSTGHRFRPLEKGTIEEYQRRAPRFIQFLFEVTSQDVALAKFYLDWFGYGLFGLAQEQRFLVMTGLGRNGKGALATAMRHVFGEYSAAADANLYMKTRFGSARSDAARADLMALKGRRLAIMSEPDGGAFNEEMLKAHTGGDPITARWLHSNNVLTWTPTHTISFLTNDPPAVSDVGPAMAARIMVADFRERYEGDNEDKSLYKTLEGEAEGIQAILVHHAMVWYASDHGLVLPERVIGASRAYISANDPIGRALDEAFVRDRRVKTVGRVLYEAYLEWHARSDEDGEPLSNNKFALALARNGFTKVHGVTGTVYTGIRPASASEIADREIA